MLGQDAETATHVAVLGLAAVAAFTDVRRGVIPNWLTLPAILFAPIVHGIVGGVGAVLASVTGLLVSALVPLIIFYRGGMGGGDVKAYAAIGALGGLYLGLEVQLLSLICASIYAVGRLAWDGRLMSTLASSLFVGLNPVLPRRWRREVSPALLHRIRLGAAIALGGLIAVAGHHRELWV